MTSAPPEPPPITAERHEDFVSRAFQAVAVPPDGAGIRYGMEFPADLFGVDLQAMAAQAD